MTSYREAYRPQPKRLLRVEHVMRAIGLDGQVALGTAHAMIGRLLDGPDGRWWDRYSLDEGAKISSIMEARCRRAFRQGRNEFAAGRIDAYLTTNPRRLRFHTLMLHLYQETDIEPEDAVDLLATRVAVKDRAHAVLLAEMAQADFQANRRTATSFARLEQLEEAAEFASSMAEPDLMRDEFMHDIEERWPRLTADDVGYFARRFFPAEPAGAEEEGSDSEVGSESALSSTAVGHSVIARCGTASGPVLIATDAARNDAILSMTSEEPVIPAAEGVDPFALEGMPSLVQDIARWAETAAYQPVAGFALPAALATLGALFSRRWATPTGLGLNTYIIGVAETGDGKDALVSAPKMILRACGYGHLIGPDRFSSDSAIEFSLRQNPAMVSCSDEFGKIVRGMMARDASVSRTVAQSMLDLYPMSAPGKEYTGKQMSGGRAMEAIDKSQEVIHSPTFSILGVAPPEDLFGGLTQGTLNDGFLNRLTLFRAGAAGKRNRNPERIRVPARLVSMLQSAYEAAAPAGNLAAISATLASSIPRIRCAEASTEAIAALDDIEDWQDAKKATGKKGIYGRVAEQSLKFATIRAVARTPDNPRVSAEDLFWAFALVKASAAEIERGVTEYMADTEFTALLNAIRRAVAQHGEEGITLRDLKRARGVSGKKDNEVMPAVARLVEIGDIVPCISEAKPGRPAKARYRSRGASDADAE